MSHVSVPSSPIIPDTPIRPQRSSRRLTMHDLPSQLSNVTKTPRTPRLSPTTTAPLRDDTPSSALPTTPTTPLSPTVAAPAASHRVAHRKSTASVRRKPVPLTPLDLEAMQNPFIVDRDHSLATPSLSLPATPRTPTSSGLEPPRYILDVDPLPLCSPLSPAGPSAAPHSPTRPPSYIAPQSFLPADSQTDLSTGVPVPQSHEDLPIYAEEPQTEPKTLARALWKWGFICPLLWLMGMAILWIPLKPIEEEQDPEKAQKLDEMIIILRKTELKYAKRCMYASSALGVGILAIVVLVIAVSQASH